MNEVKKQIEREKISGKLIHLCFTCDPYPKGYDTAPTRKIIKLIKDSGNHVQILTKNLIDRDFDLFDRSDNIGVTISGEKGKDELANLVALLKAKDDTSCKTWLSCEPVINPDTIKQCVKELHYVDLFKIGKLNYHKSDIEWRKFGAEIQELCLQHKRNYYIKDDLRAEMSKVASYKAKGNI